MQRLSVLGFTPVLFTLALAGAACGPGEGGDAGPDAGPGVPAQECDEQRPCADGLLCSDDGDCEVPPCEPGTLSCACLEEGGCQAGLACAEDETCQAIDCPQGAEGCGCFENHTCAPSPDGRPMVCDGVERVCQELVDDTEAPGRPREACFTPCSQSLSLPDGTFRYCSPEGLMDGCIGELSCVQGSCVAEGEQLPSCADGIDCPEHQTCIQNRCLSNCAYSSDCVEGAVCHQTVCRQSCTASDADSCGAGYTCHTSDGEDGVCLPRAGTGGEGPDVVERRFTVSPLSLSFTSSRVSGAFVISNPSERTLDFTVKKLEHVEISDDGRVPVVDNPLHWIEMGPLGAATRTQSFEVSVAPGESVTIQVSKAGNEELFRYEGRLRIENSLLGSEDVRIEYSTLLDGQWSGSIHYFINFDDKDLDQWLSAMQTPASPAAEDAAEDTENALLYQWTKFRASALFTLRQWDALVGATVSGSWDYKTVRQACQDTFHDEGVLCYLFADGSPDDDGLAVYTDEKNSLRIPTGALEMPFAMNLEQADGLAFQGRIETSRALQYPGDPAVSLRFGSDPTSCEGSDAQACLVDVESFDATVLAGGRYQPAPGEPCEGLAPMTTPWLVPHFLEGTVVGADGGRVRRECRESTFPVPVEDSALAPALNQSLAEANPIPDGRVRVRKLSLVDGLLINQNTLFLIVKESFESNLGDGGDADFSSYGLVRLRKAGVDLDEEAFTPGATPDLETLPEPDGLLALSCSEDLLERAGIEAVSSANAADFAKFVLDGVADGAALTPVGPTGLQPHYFCHSTGRFDGGLRAWDAEGGEACPIGSGVTYFLYGGDLRDHACQGDVDDKCLAGADECAAEQRGRCAEVLSEMQDSSDPSELVMSPVWVCAGDNHEPDRDTISCSEDRRNLLADKIFYKPDESVPALAPLRLAIDDAFRYKTRFRSRSGTTLGFVPAVCQLRSETIPYCYDPAAIEAARERMDCLVALHMDYALGTALGARVESFLQDNFSFYEVAGGGLPLDGFERLYAELLTMLGDDSFTLALGSRFDLAGSAIATFAGDLLEPDGIQLSGGAGYQMVLLYQSMQYYQLVLDRFYRQMPTLWEAIGDEQKNFITLGSISSYFNRLILASTKKAAAASEIANRYQSFNRPDLARRVIERTYAQAYLESVAIAQFMRASISVVQANQVAAVQAELNTAQIRYRAALQRMRENYEAITDNLTFFGDAPDFIPFPSLGTTDLSAVHTMLDRAFTSLETAKEREDRALASDRAFDTDAEQFQAELRQLQNQYENELAEICGTFPAGDRTYPAIPKYAHLNGIASLLGDPCGLTDNGAIYQAVGEIDAAALDLRSSVQAIRDLYAEVDIEQQRANDECAGRVMIGELQYEAAGEVLTLESSIAQLNDDMQRWDREIALLDREVRGIQSTAGLIAQGAALVDACVPSGVGQFVQAAQCAASLFVTGFQLEARQLEADALGQQEDVNRDILTSEANIRDKQVEIGQIQQAAAYQSALMECCLDAEPEPGACASPGPLLVNSGARVDTLLIGLKRAELNALRADLAVRLAQGALTALRARADRLIAQQEEGEQLLINVAAARNDPNIRIFRNAEIVDADRSFQNALVDAFRATRVYEYYTGQSYARKEELFLSRMAGRGEYNLENYLIALQRDFRDFEQSFGLPSTRVAVLSLRDDIFRIPELDAEGRALTQAQRVEALREQLTDIELLDARGYITVPFSTVLSMTSPLTALHKIKYIEAEMIGADLGDRVGRVYVTARGTGTIRSLSDEHIFHRLPAVTSVVNPFFNGVRVFDDEVYRNGRLRDRPLVNTLWELSLNQRDEQANDDINLRSLTDLRLYLYYDDFTEL